MPNDTSLRTGSAAISSWRVYVELKHDEHVHVSDDVHVKFTIMHAHQKSSSWAICAESSGPRSTDITPTPFTGLSDFVMCTRRLEKSDLPECIDNQTNPAPKIVVYNADSPFWTKER